MTGITISIIEAVQLFTGSIIGQSLLNGTIINKWKAYTKKDEETKTLLTRKLNPFTHNCWHTQ